MDRKEKQQEVFTQLVNRQLLPHGKTYKDVKQDPQWYLRFSTTLEEEKSFMEWGVNLLMEELDLTKKNAEKEMSRFIIQWGLTTNPEAIHASVSAEKIKAKN